MDKKRMTHMLLLGIRQLRLPYYQGFAAQMAFYLMLSIIPIMIVLSQLLGLFSISLDTLSDLIDKYVSVEVADVLKELIAHSSTGVMNIAFVAIALWSSSKAQFSMLRMANYTITNGQSTGKGYFRDRLKAIRTIAFTLFTVTAALIILVYGEYIFKLILNHIYGTAGIEHEIDGFLLFLRWPAALTLYFLMVSYNYYSLPYNKVKFREILPGSIFASIAMLVITLLYELYMEYVINFDIIYGSLASAIALMLWFFFLAWALELGVLCNKAWEDTKRMENIG